MGAINLVTEILPRRIRKRRIRQIRNDLAEFGTLGEMGPKVILCTKFAKFAE